MGSGGREQAGPHQEGRLVGRVGVETGGVGGEMGGPALRRWDGMGGAKGRGRGSLAWSPSQKFDKYSKSRIRPNLQGPDI